MTTPQSVTVASWFGPIRTLAERDEDHERPRAKIRGRRSYYRRLRRDADRFTVQPTGWYDLMHWHVDWHGAGNRSWRERREHLLALFTMFRSLLSATRDWTLPHQVWVLVDPADGSQDAVYLHTPNPNRNDFPIDIPGIDWDAPVPERLRDLVAEPSWQFGRLDDRSTQFFVRRRPEGRRAASRLAGPGRP